MSGARIFLCLPKFPVICLTSFIPLPPIPPLFTIVIPPSVIVPLMYGRNSVLSYSFLSPHSPAFRFGSRLVRVPSPSCGAFYKVVTTGWYKGKKGEKNKTAQKKQKWTLERREEKRRKKKRTRTTKNKKFCCLRDKNLIHCSSFLFYFFFIEDFFFFVRFFSFFFFPPNFFFFFF